MINIRVDTKVSRGRSFFGGLRESGIDASAPINENFSKTSPAGAAIAAMLSHVNAQKRTALSYMRDRGENVMKDIIGAYVHTAIDHTPIDTGTAVVNWNVVLDDDEAPAYEDHKMSPLEPEEARERAHNIVDEQINDITIVHKKGAVNTERVSVVNNTPYITALDNGWSSAQAPEGMTIFALEAAQNALQESLRGARTRGTRRKGLLEAAKASLEE